MMVIGLIGGVGAGKSTVLKVLENEFDWKVYKADDIGRSFYKPGSKVYIKIRELLGDENFLPGGDADTEKISKLIFSNPDMKKKLEDIIHPNVWRFLDYIVSASNKNDTLCIETALPDESFVKSCDKVIYVYANRDERIKRLMKERGYSREKAESIMDTQPTDEEYRMKSDIVIDNTGSEKETLNEIYKLCKW